MNHNYRFQRRLNIYDFQPSGCRIRNILLVFVTFVSLVPISECFTQRLFYEKLHKVALLPPLHHSSRNDYNTNKNSNDDDDADDESFKNLMSRVNEMRLKITDHDIHLPPHPSISPPDVIRHVLSALLHPDDPLPDYGYRLLLRSSTPHWRCSILSCIGAPPDAADYHVTAALGAALSRPKNKFGILVGGEDYEYVLHFPTDVVDFDDGECWVESRLVRKGDGMLLVSIGWELTREEGCDGSWLIDDMNWTDFRDEYRQEVQTWERVV